MSVFTEHPARYTMNRQLARNATYAPAKLADGEPGVMVRWGRSFLVLSTAEAVEFATRIVEIVEASNAALD